MARVALVQNFAYEYLGILYIEAVLRREGHQVEVFLDLGSQKKLLSEIKSFVPDLVGLTATTTARSWALNLASKIKEVLQTRIILGGPHPTYFPEVIEDPAIDIICRGEGELPMVELANKIDKQLDLSDVLSCWFKVDGNIIRNEQAGLMENLDLLPFPNHDIYYRKYPFLDVSRKAFMATRGCPFDCSYCYNHGLKKLYQGRGKYVRRRSVNNVIDEIKKAIETYRLKTIYMQDDTFILDEEWVTEFMGRYKKEINRPLICLIRCDLTNESLVRTLKKGGCKAVFFGIETGDETLRNHMLKKSIKDKQIYETANLLKAYGIKFRTYNMLGLPGETLAQMSKTVKMNIDIGTNYPWCAIFQPFPGTELGDYTKQAGFAQKMNLYDSTSYFQYTSIRSDHQNEVVNLQKLFFYAVKFPKLFPFIMKIIKIHPNPVFTLFFLISYGWCYYKSENLLFSEMVSIGARNFRSLFNYEIFRGG